MLIFYFTGTGNSLAAAKALNGERISIPQARETSYRDSAIGIVFPLYCLNPPKMVREFLRRTKFETEYLFAIATYGNLAGAAMEELQKMVQPYGYQFGYLNTLLMVDNFLPNFEIKEEIARLPQKKTQECLAQIVSDIRLRKRGIPEATPQERSLSAMCVPLMEQQDKGESAKDFVIDDHCTACGICAKVCPGDNISEERVFKNQCESCYACIHACPHHAIHVKNEKSTARWRNPAVTLEELIQANCRKSS